jgi:hypothetical protein
MDKCFLLTLKGSDVNDTKYKKVVSLFICVGQLKCKIHSNTF